MTLPALLTPVPAAPDRPRSAGAVLSSTAVPNRPPVIDDRAAALDQAYDEFCTREEAGEVVDSVAFCARFPFAASLRRLIRVHRFLDDHPDALGGTPTTWPDPAEPLGDFRVIREIGRGGFARVYLGTETTAGNRPVVLKVSAAGSREADTLGPLSHPHLVPVLSSRQVGMWSVVAMPFAGTATLEDVLSVAGPHRGATAPRSAGVIVEATRGGARDDDPPVDSPPPSPLRPGMTYETGVAAVAAGLLDGVVYLHQRKLAHRDLKPSNVLLGPTAHPYLLDFNLASAESDPQRLAGTVPYMAPEQLELLIDPNASPPPDWRPADVFACGVILFELLTGQHPFGEPDSWGTTGRTAIATALLAAQKAGHPPLARLNPRVGRAVRKAVEQCLAVDPHDRPTAVELAGVFHRVTKRPAAGAWMWAAALAGVALAAGAGVALTQRPSESPTAAAVVEPRPTVERLAPSPDAEPTDPFGHAAWLYREKGQHDLATKEFLDCGMKTADGRAFACAAYLLSFGPHPNHDAAAIAATEAILDDYDTAEVYANRAYNRLQSSGRNATARLLQARADCDMALEFDPTLRPARLTRAMVHHRLYEVTRAGKKPIPISHQAIIDIELVLESGPNTADVWMLAAQLYILAPDGPMLDHAVNAVREAVLAGKSPDAVMRNETLVGALKGHPDFDEIAYLPPGHPVPVKNLHLINPIP